MRVLMDTCVISELIKTPPDRNVLAWFERTSEEDIYISCMTMNKNKNISAIPGTLPMPES